MSNVSNTPGGAAGPASPAAPQAQPAKGRDALWWVLASFLTLVLLAGLAIWQFIPGFYTRLAGNEAHGIAYNVSDCGTTDDNGNETYKATVLFRDAAGQLQESTSGDDCTSAIKNGDAITLWYFPSDPGTSFLDGDPSITFYILGSLLLVGLLACLGFFGYWAWVLIKASIQQESFTRLGVAALACLVILASLLPVLHFFPPPADQLHNGPTHNYQVNEPVGVAGLWSITVQGRNLARVGGLHAANRADTVCLELDITLRNTTRQTLAFEVNQFALFDAQANVIDTSCSVDVPKLGSGQVAPGKVMQGALAYRVSATLRDFYLAFRPGAPEENVGRFFWHLQATFSSTPGLARPSVV